MERRAVTPISSLTPLEAAAPAPAPSWRASAAGALEGAAFTVPVSIGSVTLLFSRVSPGALSAAVFATLLALAFIHLANLRARRPVMYCSRFFEATTLAAMLDELVLRLPAWSIPDTPGVRLALLCTVGAGAGLFVALLYLLRADRFSRYIPAPVFAGFSNGIAVVLFSSQIGSIVHAHQNGVAVTVQLIAVAALATGFAVRAWAPRWPAAATALLLGLTLGFVWQGLGIHVPMIGAGGGDAALFPVLLADFHPLLGGAQTQRLAGLLAGDAAVLGTMMFLNTTIASQLLTQSDDRPRERTPMLVWSALCMSLAGAAGSAPLSGSMQSSSAATRHVPFTAAMLLVTGMLTAAVALSGLPAHIPLAAVAGALIAEGWFMVDRPSLRNLVAWARGRPVSAHAREDISLIVAVTATAVFVNMVAAVFAGLMLGLLLFAVRNARRPVRQVWTGLQLASNCARPRGDLRMLREHGERLKVLEFERDLFFGSVESLERMLKAELPGAECIVLDWSPVRHLDSSAALTVAKFERGARAAGVMVIHAEQSLHAETRSALDHYLPLRVRAEDLDHALEAAENRIIALHPAGSGQETTMMDAVSLLQGLDDAQRQRVEHAMEQRVVSRGEPLVRAGDASSELLLVLQGHASVLLPQAGGGALRVAGVRRGAAVGEMGFLDGSLRSASVVAEEDTLVAVLTREAFDRLGREDPALAQKLLANIAIDVTARLRHSNLLATARHSRA